MSSEADVEKLKAIIRKLEVDNKKLHSKLTSSNILLTPEPRASHAARTPKAETKQPIKMRAFEEDDSDNDLIELLMSEEVQESRMRSISLNGLGCAPSGIIEVNSDEDSFGDDAWYKLTKELMLGDGGWYDQMQKQMAEGTWPESDYQLPELTIPRRNILPKPSFDSTPASEPMNSTVTLISGPRSRSPPPQVALTRPSQTKLREERARSISPRRRSPQRGRMISPDRRSSPMRQPMRMVSPQRTMNSLHQSTPVASVILDAGGDNNYGTIDKGKRIRLADQGGTFDEPFSPITMNMTRAVNPPVLHAEVIMLDETQDIGKKPIKTGLPKPSGLPRLTKSRIARPASRISRPKK